MSEYARSARCLNSFMKNPASAASRRLPGSTTSAHGFSLRPFTTYVNENASAYDERECYALRAYIHSDCERRMAAASAFAKFLSYPPGFVDS